MANGKKDMQMQQKGHAKQPIFRHKVNHGKQLFRLKFT